jgi:hypothetical protein
MGVLDFIIRKVALVLNRYLGIALSLPAIRGTGEEAQLPSGDDETQLPKEQENTSQVGGELARIGSSLVVV